MKILLFTEIYDCGGIDTFIINLINNWPIKEDTFVIVANESYPGLDIIENNLSRPSEIVRHKKLIYSNLCNSSTLLRTTLRFLGPILRYFFIGFNILSFRSLLLATNADALMVINGGYPSGDSCRAAALSWGMFSVKPLSIHNFHNIAQRAPWYLFLQEWVVDWLMCQYSAKFVTVSNAAAKSISFRPLIDRKNITSYIHNGLSITHNAGGSENSVRDEIGISRTTPLCLMLATYEPRKGHYFLFTAFKKVLKEIPDVHLLVCGYGFPHEIECVSGYVRDMNLQDNVHLMGFRTDAAELLNSSDILVVASQAYESFGYTSIEAMANKVPVVATNVGGIPEVVADGEGGYCVAHDDVNSYADHITLLLKDKKLREEQGDLGYKRYKDLFSAEKMAAQYAEMIHASVILETEIIDQDA